MNEPVYDLLPASSNRPFRPTYEDNDWAVRKKERNQEFSFSSCERFIIIYENGRPAPRGAFSFEKKEIKLYFDERCEWW